MLPLAAVVCLLASSELASAQSSTYIDALKCYQDNNFVEGGKLFLKEIADNPQNDAAYFYYANLLMNDTQHQDVPKIEKLLKTALELAPGNYWYKYDLAIFYLKTERPELGSVLLEELIAEHPKKTDLYVMAANNYLMLKDIDKAIATMDKITRIGGKNEMLCLTEMDLLSQKNGGDETESYKFLEEYYKGCKTPRLASMLADWYSASYRDSLAMQLYNEAIDMDNGYSPAYFGRAHMFEKMRQYENYFSDIRHFMTDEVMPVQTKTSYLEQLMQMPQFVMAFKPEVDSLVVEAHNTHPTDSVLNNTVSLYYYKSGDSDAAIEYMRQNFNIYPESYPIGFQYLLMLYYCEKWDSTADVATVLLQKWPDIHDPLIVRAMAFRQQGNNQAAIEDYEALAATAPRDSATIIQAYPSLGDLYFQEGNVRKAFKCYDKALKADPENILTLNNYAYYMSLGKIKLKKAKEMSKKTIEKEPDNPTYLDTYAWILHLMGDDVEAKAIFKHAMLYGGKEQATILDHYAEVLYSLKEYDLAFIYWNQCRAMLEGDEAAKIEKRIKERKEQLNNK